MSDTAPNGLTDDEVTDLTASSHVNTAAEMLFNDETPSELVPKMGEFAVTNSAFYERLVMTEFSTDGVEANDIEERIDPFRQIDNPGADTPALGVMLTFEQGWRQQGLALGELRYSLSLAPGEVTQVAVVDWRRQSRSGSAESTAQADRVVSQSDDSQSQTAIHNAVEHQSRDTAALNLGMASQTQGSISGGGLLIGGSGSHASSLQLGLSATSATGSRDVTSQARENIQRHTTQAAQAVRSRRSTSVREVSEQERSETTTRVVANYNHMHALTIQYFEVLQAYELSTKVISAERCVFVPMRVFTFDDELIDHPDVVELLRSVLVDLGEKALITSLDNLERKASVTARLESARNDLKEISNQIDQAWATVANEVEKALTALRSEPGFLFEVPKAGAVLQHLRARIARNERLLPKVDGDTTSMFAAVDHIGAEGREALEILRELEPAQRELEEHIGALRQAAPRDDKLFEILQDNELFLNQQMWMRMEKHRWHQMVLDRSYKGEPLGGLVDPAPIGYFGNYVAFRWDFAAEDIDRRRDFERAFKRNGARDIESRIVIPSEGVFAEAVLGQSNSAERIDLTRFWNWQDSPIPILPPSIQPVSTGSRARDIDFGGLDFAAALATLKEQQLLAANAVGPTVIAALQSSLLGDSGLREAASAGSNAGNNAAAGADSAQEASLQVSKQIQDFVVGMANSEVGKIAATAGLGAATGGVSTVGGLVNAAVKVGGKAAVSKAADKVKG